MVVGRLFKNKNKTLPHCFPGQLLYFIAPPAMCEWSRVSTSLSALGASSFPSPFFFFLSHFGKCVMVSHCEFICISLMATAIKHLFMGLFAIRVLSLVKSVIFFPLNCLLLHVEFQEFFKYPRDQLLVGIWSANIFSPSVVYFHPLDSLSKSKSFNVDKVQFIIFFPFRDYIFSIKSENLFTGSRY